MKMQLVITVTSGKSYTSKIVEVEKNMNDFDFDFNGAKNLSAELLDGRLIVFNPKCISHIEVRWEK